MGVQLNIKDPETVRLARELADRTGRSMTETIRIALQRAYDDREREITGRMAAVTRISAEFRHAMPVEWQGKDSREIVGATYNADGSFAE